MFAKFLLRLVSYPHVLDLLPERLKPSFMRCWVSLTLLVLNAMLSSGLFDRRPVLDEIRSQEIRLELLDDGILPF
jgi:hypothetical protein